MTNEELCTCIQAGERDKLPELWQQNEKYVRWRARKLLRLCGGDYYGMAEEDLYNTGYIGMAGAVDHYDPDAGVKFLTFFGYYLFNAWQEAAGLHRSGYPDPLLSCISLDYPLDDTPDSDTLGDLQEDQAARQALEDVENRIYTEQLHAALEKSMNLLPVSQRDAIIGVYYEGQTRRAVAKKKGISDQAVHDAEKRALHKMARRPELERFVDRRTNFYTHVNSQTFASTQTSAVEKVVLKREEDRARFLAETYRRIERDRAEVERIRAEQNN